VALDVEEDDDGPNRDYLATANSPSYPIILSAFPRTMLPLRIKHFEGYRDIPSGHRQRCIMPGPIDGPVISLDPIAHFM